MLAVMKRSYIIKDHIQVLAWFKAQISDHQSFAHQVLDCLSIVPNVAGLPSFASGSLSHLSTTKGSSSCR